MDPAVE